MEAWCGYLAGTDGNGSWRELEHGTIRCSPEGGKTVTRFHKSVVMTA